MPSTVHPEITPWFIHHFQTQMVERAHLAHTTMRHTGIQLDDRVRSILAGSIAQHLAALEAANNILRDMHPASFADLNTPFIADFKHWRGFRDDAAHPADRCSRISPSWHHNAKVPEPRFGTVFEVLQYDYATDSLNTGSWHSLHFPPALLRAREVVNHTLVAIIRAVAVDKAFDFPPIVTPRGKPLQILPAELHKCATVRHSDDGQIVLVVR